MGKALAYLATAVVACFASPFVVLASIFIPTLILFLLLSLLGVVTVAVTLLIPIMVAAAVIFVAIYCLFRLLG